MSEVIVSRTKIQRWFREHVGKNEKSGLRMVASKLGCEPNEEEVLNALLRIYARKADAKKMFELIMENEENIRKGINQKLNKMVEVAEFSDPLSLRTVSEEESLLTQLADLQDKLNENNEKLETSDRRVDEIDGQLKEYTNKIFETEKLIRKLKEEKKSLHSEKNQLVTQMSELKEETTSLVAQTKEIEAELLEVRALHFTIDEECVSEKCVLANMECNKEEFMEMFIKISMGDEECTSEFQILRESATMEEIKKVVEILLFASKQPAEKKQYWHFAKSCNVAELLKCYDVNVIVG